MPPKIANVGSPISPLIQQPIQHGLSG